MDKEYNSLHKKLDEIINEELELDYIESNRTKLYEFADLVPEDTNLSSVIWVDGNRNTPHGKRIKFQNNNAKRLNGGELIPVTISDEPQIPKSVKTKIKISQKELNEIKEWIKLNKDVLIKYGNGEITTKQLYLLLQPLGEE